MKKFFSFLLIILIIVTGYFLYYHRAKIKNYIITHIIQPQKQTSGAGENRATSKENEVELGTKISLLSNEGISENVEINFFGQKVAIAPLPKVNINPSPDPDDCYETSYRQVSDEFLVSLNHIFENLGIAENPFGQILFLIKLFSTFTSTYNSDYNTIIEILNQRTSNTVSNAIATVAIMNKLGWDIQCFYNDTKCYLGVNFTKNWEIKKEIWIVENNRKYLLKEFNTLTPAGEVLIYDPKAKYLSLEQRVENLRPVPLMKSLPIFPGEVSARTLRWEYNNIEYSLTINIPHEQILFADNLPKSLFGMVFCGREELENSGLSGKLNILTQDMNEYDRVNFLLKFCHSEDIFSYDSKELIKSVSRQLLEGKNDCDGRSVVLYSLLIGVLDYLPSDIVFVQWPKHLTLALKPITTAAQKKLSKYGEYVEDKFYILDATFTGDTFWGHKIPNLTDEYVLIKHADLAD